jgi:ACT domain-containing protein
MPLSEFEISKIAEIVAGKVGTNLDAKALRQVIDRVVDSLKQQQGNPEITGVTCEAPRTQATPTEPPAPSPAYTPSPGARPPDQEMLNRQGGLYEQIEKTNGNRIIIAAFGRNRPGVVAAITAILAENKCNIEDISQKIMQEFFSMIMIVDISACPIDFATLSGRLQETETQLGMKVYVMHEDIFRYMHRI